MPKRPHGTGHVYVKWGSFYGWWRTPDGRLLNRRIGKVRERGTSEGLTRRQAESALCELVARENTRPRRLTHEPGKTVDDAVDALRARLALEGARPSYRQNCASMQRVHLSPRLGPRRLETVDREAVEHLALAMPRKGLAPKTVLNVLKFLHQAFALAVERGWITENPVTRAARPKRRRHGVAAPDLQFLTLTELDAVSDAFPDLRSIRRHTHAGAGGAGRRHRRRPTFSVPCFVYSSWRRRRRAFARARFCSRGRRLR